MADIHRRQEGDHVILTVGGEVTVSSAAALRTELVEALEAGATVAVAVEPVTAVDVSFPQLLCSAHRTAAARNKALTVTGLAQERLTAMLHRTGFSRQTGCQENTRETCLWLCKQEPGA